MRDLMEDSRMMLLALGAEGVEATGRGLAALWQRASRTGRLSQQLRNLEAAGLIVQQGTGPIDGRLIRASELGRRFVLGAFDPEARWARWWDGAWRMVMFDVPEAQASLRVRLRRQLRDLRFGWLQNSVWLSPDPMKELVDELTAAEINVESLLFMEGRPAGGEGDIALVAGAWDFARLAKVHAAYLKVLSLRPPAGPSTKSAGWAAWVATEARAWREVLRCDPFLPEKLWPRGYQGREVWNARREALRGAGVALAASLTAE